MADCVFSSQRRFKGITEKHIHTCTRCEREFSFEPRDNINKENILFLEHRTLHLYNICLNCSINKWNPEKQKYQVYMCSYDLHPKPLHRDELYRKCFPRGCFHLTVQFVDQEEYQEIQQYFEKHWHCCDSPNIKHDKKSGEVYCANCGTVHQQKTVATSVRGRTSYPKKRYLESSGRPNSLNDPWEEHRKKERVWKLSNRPEKSDKITCQDCGKTFNAERPILERVKCPFCGKYTLTRT